MPPATWVPFLYTSISERSESKSITAPARSTPVSCTSRRLQLASHPQRAKVSALRSGIRTLDQDALEAYKAAEGRAQVLREGWEGVGKPVMAAGRAQAAREVLRKKHAGPEPSEVVTSRGASDHKEIGMTALEAPIWLWSAMPLARRSTSSTPTKPRDRLPTKNPAARREN